MPQRRGRSGRRARPFVAACLSAGKLAACRIGNERSAGLPRRLFVHRMLWEFFPGGGGAKWRLRTRQKHFRVSAARALCGARPPPPTVPADRRVTRARGQGASHEAERSLQQRNRR